MRLTAFCVAQLQREFGGANRCRRAIKLLVLQFIHCKSGQIRAGRHHERRWRFILRGAHACCSNSLSTHLRKQGTVRGSATLTIRSPIRFAPGATVDVGHISLANGILHASHDATIRTDRMTWFVRASSTPIQLCAAQVQWFAQRWLAARARSAVGDGLGCRKRGRHCEQDRAARNDCDRAESESCDQPFDRAATASVLEIAHHAWCFAP